MESQNLLDSNQVADMIGIRPDTLRQYRHLGTGPAFVKLGRLVRYKPDTVLEWIASLEEQTLKSRP